MRGKPVAVIASGPSVTRSDIQLIRDHGIIMVAVNSSWEWVRDCRAIVAGDYRWWKAHAENVDIDAIKLSRSQKAHDEFGARKIRTKMKGGYNSGQAAVEWVIQKGASNVILLGFDATLENGMHHFGDHVETPNPTEHRVKLWHKQFKELRSAYPKADIVNCSRHTALDAFPIVRLEDALASVSEP